MTRIISWPDIRLALEEMDVIDVMREAFIAHANGEVIIPPVGEMTFDDPPGDVHIKYGAFHHGEHYIVKIASGFYNNDQLGVPSSQGMMILFANKRDNRHVFSLTRAN